MKGKAIGALVAAASAGRRRSLAALAPPPGAGGPLLRRRVDGDVRARLSSRRAGSYRSRRRSSPPRAVPPASWTTRLARRDSQARVPRGGFPAALGPPVAVLPRQVPLRDPARPARSPGRAARGGRPRGGSGRGSPCRARARRRCSRRVGVARVRASLPHRPQGREAVATEQRIEGEFEPGERVCLVEDVVTTGGAAIDAATALREAGLTCERAVCVVDREEGGSEALAAAGVSPPYRCFSPARSRRPASAAEAAV